MNIIYTEVKRVFLEYIREYNVNDPKISLKIEHTFQVAELSKIIAETIDEVDENMAWLIGILHDIGRFEQVTKYNTFVDADSIDHAELAVDILFSQNMIDKFGDFSEEEKRIIKVSIGNHSKYRVDESVTQEEKIYCNILRDADKIDIFRVNCETPLEDIYNVTKEALETDMVSFEVKDCFFNKRSVLRSLKQSSVDYIVGHICLVFELVYPISKRIAKEQGYVDNLLNFQSKNSDTKEWFKYMHENLW